MGNWRQGRWGNAYLNYMDKMQEAKLSDALAGEIRCPICNKIAVSRVYNHAMNRYEFKHSRRPRGGHVVTTYCHVAPEAKTGG